MGAGERGKYLECGGNEDLGAEAGRDFNNGGKQGSGGGNI